MTIELTEGQERYLKEKGITDPIAYLMSLIEFEEYIYDNWTQQAEEAWADIES